MSKFRLICLSAILLAITQACSFDESQGLGVNDETSALLNEILFLPAQGQFQFVEIKALRSISLDGLSLANENEQIYTPPSGLRLNADEVALIVFDGQNKVEGNIIHADLSEFLNPDSGYVNLITLDGIIVDHVTWGESQGDSVNLSRGGFIPTLVPGTAIGRVPGSVAVSPYEWVTFSVEQATPGALNLSPSVEVILPFDGAIFTQPDARLSWYTVAGATEYRIQISSDSEFATVLVEEILPAPESNALSMLSLTTSQEQGMYFWRVQTVTADGDTNISPTSVFEISPAGSSAEVQEHWAALDVPHFFQRKDTNMLVLEGPAETGPDAWDQPYQDPGPRGGYCARASVKMVNAYYGGELSQDRIAYEVFHNLKEGPEQDLIVRGMYYDEIETALRYALGGEVTRKINWWEDDENAFWNDVVSEIDSGRPVFVISVNHAFVAIGYRENENGRFVIFNDPAIGRYEWELDLENPLWMGTLLYAYWILPPMESANPESDEPEIFMNTDPDGVVDFDEIQRFHTDPNSEDTDGDEVGDKEDIRASVFDSLHGYVIAQSMLGRDFDSDGSAMELDADSDGGGCADGIEDINFNGDFEQDQQETYNFARGDDVCIGGTDETYYDAVFHHETGTTDHKIWRLYATYSLKPGEGGILTGSAQISYEYVIETIESGDAACPPFTTEMDPPIARWQADLTGTYQINPDGTVSVAFSATPDQGPPYTLSGVYCGELLTVAADGIPWYSVGGTLKDGVYNSYDDLPLSESETGEYWNKVHMQQAENP
jgi:hypothetical protein